MSQKSSGLAGYSGSYLVIFVRYQIESSYLTSEILQYSVDSAVINDDMIFICFQLDQNHPGEYKIEQDCKSEIKTDAQELTT